MYRQVGLREKNDPQACLNMRSVMSSPIGRSPLGSSVHEILKARILEWVAIPYSRGSSRPRDRTWVARDSVHGKVDSLPEPPGKPCVQACRVLLCFAVCTLQICMLYRLRLEEGQRQSVLLLLFQQHLLTSRLCVMFGNPHAMSNFLITISDTVTSHL